MKKIRVLHSDRGGEYLSEQFNSFLENKGTERKLTVHDTPEENGVAERLNRTLVERVRAMVIGSQLPTQLWGECLMHVVWIKNCTWTRALPPGITPYELLTGNMPELEDVPEWGAIVWVHNTTDGKLGDRAKEGRWIGYDRESKGHQIYWKERWAITVERSIVFSKKGLPIIEDLSGVDVFQGESDDEEEFTHREEDVAPEPNEEPTVEVPEPTNPMLPEICHPECQKQPSRYVRDIQSGEFSTGTNEKLPKGLQVPTMDEEINGIAMSVKMDEVSGLLPSSLNEAMQSPDWLRWKEAMDEEREALEAHGTWKVVDAPKGSNVIGCRWVYAIKRDAAGNIVRYTARLVAQGFSQISGIDFFDTYAPVAKMASI
jgi:hypothetical protein